MMMRALLVVLVLVLWHSAQAAAPAKPRPQSFDHPEQLRMLSFRNTFVRSTGAGNQMRHMVDGRIRVKLPGSRVVRTYFLTAPCMREETFVERGLLRPGRHNQLFLPVAGTHTVKEIRLPSWPGDEKFTFFKQGLLPVWERLKVMPSFVNTRRLDDNGIVRSLLKGTEVNGKVTVRRKDGLMWTSEFPIRLYNVNQNVPDNSPSWLKWQVDTGPVPFFAADLFDSDVHPDPDNATLAAVYDGFVAYSANDYMEWLYRTNGTHYGTLWTVLDGQNGHSVRADIYGYRSS